MIRYEVVGAPKNPFEAASRKALGVSTNVTTQTPETGTVETRHDEEFFSANSVRTLEKTTTVNEENPEDIPQTTFQGPASSSVSDACDSALSMTMEKRAFDQIENEREVNDQEVKRQKMYEDSKIDVLVAPNFPHMSEDDLCSSSSDSSSNFQFDDPPQKMSPLVSLLNSDCKVLNFFVSSFSLNSSTLLKQTCILTYHMLSSRLKTDCSTQFSPWEKCRCSTYFYNFIRMMNLSIQQ